MNKKEMVMWVLFGLLTISSVSLHMDTRTCEKRTQGITERMGRGDAQSRWAGMKKEGPQRVRPERVMPEGRKGKRERPEKKK